MAMRAPRQFQVPRALCSPTFGPSTTLDEAELIASSHSGPAAEWAAKLVARENGRILDELLGDSDVLPRGVLSSAAIEDMDVVTALVDADGRVWTAEDGWQEGDNDTLLASVELDDNDVAFVVRALKEGSDGVAMRDFFPLGFVSAAIEGGQVETPEGSVVVSIVDPIDKDAVLEMLAIAPGPTVLRRHNGQWQRDDDWVSVLSSVKPPPMVKLDGAQVASVAAQVDAATADVDFEPFKVEDREMYAPINASAYVRELTAEADQRGIDMNLALIAVAGRQATPKDVAATERLRRYWLYGKGAAKIRWGTPGSWRRCYRNLVKHLGPRITPGYCTNLSKRLGGPGVATHVGDRRGRG